MTRQYLCRDHEATNPMTGPSSALPSRRKKKNEKSGRSEKEERKNETNISRKNGKAVPIGEVLGHHKEQDNATVPPRTSLTTECVMETNPSETINKHLSKESTMRTGDPALVLMTASTTTNDGLVSRPLLRSADSMAETTKIKPVAVPEFNTKASSSIRQPELADMGLSVMRVIVTPHSESQAEKVKDSVVDRQASFGEGRAEGRFSGRCVFILFLHIRFDVGRRVDGSGRITSSTRRRLAAGIGQPVRLGQPLTWS